MHRKGDGDTQPLSKEGRVLNPTANSKARNPPISWQTTRPSFTPDATTATPRFHFRDLAGRRILRVAGYRDKSQCCRVARPAKSHCHVVHFAFFPWVV
mmetsp:Transcript_7072/g.19764  ORF Transcript_7072/g.19764 Transcript_7072/m.19764 type:complete len:98 (-) Transcript_7072:338-631(-)